VDPRVRQDDVAPVLHDLGVRDIDTRTDPDALAAAAALCEAAGRVALPYPIAACLLGHDDGHPLAVVSTRTVRVDHGDLFARWRVVDLDGSGGVAEPAAARLGTRLGPFVTDLTITGPAEIDPTDGHRWLALTAWQMLGTSARAVELAVDHVNGRVQFGKPIAAFQTVQFALADCAVAVAGLRELASFTLWRLHRAPDEALADVLALRVHAIDVTRSVLRTCQQLHGAAGVCDEYDISVLTRMVQPAMRLPHGAERSTEQLAAAIRRDGFAGLFDHRQPAP
jgi:hypothetical protein